MEKLHAYNTLLVQKNKVINLTAHRDEASSWKYNVLDSLLFNDKLTPYMPGGVRVLDLGSGGGCPAIPLAVSFPDADITMVDSVRKKVNFLNEVIKRLSLKNARAIHSRIEDLTGLYDVVVARAVAPMNTLLEYALPFVKVGGVFLAYKGANVEGELISSKKALATLGGVVKSVEKAPLDEGTFRYLVVVKKVKSTLGYPRAGNLPRVKPL